MTKVRKVYTRKFDPDGYIICRTCDVAFPRTNEYFYRNKLDSYGLARVCKTCDNKRRAEKEKERAYHNIPKRCKSCDGFFYASLAAINKSKRRKKYSSNDVLYCSVQCIKRSGRNWSWNGERRGSNNPHAKYSEEIIKKVKLALKDGMKTRDIKEIYKINKSTISSIRLNKSWTHVAI